MSGPRAASPADRRDEAVRLQGRLWTDQVRWAAKQPPLRMPDDAAAHLAAWRAEVDPRNVGRFETRLARDGLTLESAAAVFAAPDEADLAEPAWWSTYQRLVAALAHVEGASVEAQLDADPIIRDTIPFAHLLLPITTSETRRLLCTVDQPVADQVQRDLHLDLLSRVCQASAAAFSAVMWRDVPYGAKFLARAGVTEQPAPRDRYLAFCDHHRRNGLSEILVDYPCWAGCWPRWSTSGTDPRPRCSRGWQWTGGPWPRGSACQSTNHWVG